MSSSCNAGWPTGAIMLQWDPILSKDIKEMQKLRRKTFSFLNVFAVGLVGEGIAESMVLQEEFV